MNNLICCAKSEPKTHMHLYSLEYSIKLVISDFAYCHIKNKTNLGNFPHWAYTGLYWPIILIIIMEFI